MSVYVVEIIINCSCSIIFHKLTLSVQMEAKEDFFPKMSLEMEGITTHIRIQEQLYGKQQY